jgi:diguanylate cyclase
MHKSSNPLKNQIISIVLALLVWFMVFGVLQTLAKYEKNKHLAKEKQDAENYGELLRSSVDRELNSLLFISNGLASYLSVYKEELDSSKVNAILKDMWSRAKHVRNLGVAVGYHFKYVYPIEGNESVIGVDLHNLHSQWPKVQMAITSRQGILDGPLDLIQGGSGIIYRYPVFIKDQYWGILSTVIDTQPFLEDAFHRNHNHEYDFAIRTQDGNVFYGDPNLFKHKRVVLIVSNLPNGKWEWAIEKRDVQKPTYFYVLDALSLVLSTLAALSVYYYFHKHNSLSREALIDSLTNLPNRRYLEKALLSASADAERNREMIAVMLIDLDYFKSINDTRGHAFGDAALIKVAEIIQSQIRGNDILSRIGGDEFVLVLNHLKSANDAKKVATKVIKAFNEMQSILGIPVRLSLSIGLTTSIIGKKINIKQLIKQADEALYLAKGEGRGRYKVYEV